MTVSTWTGHECLPDVSPLLSSGFVPGFFSWSTVCALDEEHPMFEKKVEMNEKTTTFRRKDNPGWSLLAKTSCAAVETWTAAALQFLREAGYHYLHWSVFTYIHGLLPFLSTMSTQDAAVQSPLLDSLIAFCSKSHYSNRRRRRTCWCPPLSRSNPSGGGPPPGGSVYGSKCTMVLCICL